MLFVLLDPVHELGQASDFAFLEFAEVAVDITAQFISCQVSMLDRGVSIVGLTDDCSYIRSAIDLKLGV